VQKRKHLAFPLKLIIKLSDPSPGIPDSHVRCLTILFYLLFKRNVELIFAPENYPDNFAGSKYSLCKAGKNINFISGLELTLIFTWKLTGVSEKIP
jgi:hypothetical protein